MMVTTTPVVLLIYRRPDLIRGVAERVFAANPSLLLVVADGPRDSSERRLCDEARGVIRDLAWSCEVRWNVAETNLGLRERVSSGLDWAFSQVERAIILEEDCLPEATFFPFCDELLERYRDDERVFAIAGGNYQFGRRRSRSSYHFSAYCGIWGWATWKRAWQHYDVDMRRWPELRASGLLEAVCHDTREKRYWNWIFENVREGRIDTWDYQLQLAMWQQHALFVVPEVSLVSNIGFGKGGTHTQSSRHRLAAVSVGSLRELEHPNAVYRNHQADRFIFRRVLRGNIPLWMRELKRAVRGR